MNTKTDKHSIRAIDIKLYKACAKGDAYGDGRLVDILDPARKALFVEFGASPK